MVRDNYMYLQVFIKSYDTVYLQIILSQINVIIHRHHIPSIVLKEDWLLLHPVPSMVLCNYLDQKVRFITQVYMLAYMYVCNYVHTVFTYKIWSTYTLYTVMNSRRIACDEIDSVFDSSELHSQTNDFQSSINLLNPSSTGKNRSEISANHPYRSNTSNSTNSHQMSASEYDGNKQSLNFISAQSEPNLHQISSASQDLHSLSISQLPPGPGVLHLAAK